MGLICKHSYDKRLKEQEEANFERDLLNINEDITTQSRRF